MLKKILRSRFVQNALGTLLAGYMRFVDATSRKTVRRQGGDLPKDHLIRPGDGLGHMKGAMPFIATFWHGQHFMMSFAYPKGLDFRVMISRSRDGEINAIAARKLGAGVVRGAGDTKNKGAHKGGGTAFLGLLRALRDGACVAMTADVPKIARKAGLGVITLAQRSGRPIVPVAYASSRRIDFNSWDRASLNLPFSRVGLVIGDPIIVARDADDSAMEQARQTLEQVLNAITTEAYALAGGREPQTRQNEVGHG